MYMAERGRGMEDMTIDRKIEDGPYEIGNIQVISKRENIKKFNVFYREKVKSHYDWSDAPF